MKKSEHKIEPQNKNVFENRDLNQQLRFPTLSWSSINSFTEYDRNIWFDQYVLGNRTAPNPQMEVGIRLGERWATDPTFLPEVERPEIFEHNLSAYLDDIFITGHLDGLHLTKKKKLQELKTTSSKTKWTTKSVRKWGQITCYAYLLYKNYGIKPEDLEMELIYIPVAQIGDFTYEQSGPPVIIPTERNMLDLVRFGKFIKDTHAQMLAFVGQKKLSPVDPTNARSI